MHSTSDIVQSEKKKPKMILDYNNTKGGVDTFDQMIHEYSSKRKTNRWPLSYFYNLMDASALAAYHVWITTNRFWKTQIADRRCEFLKTLCENLVAPLIARRTEKLVGVCLETKSAMDLFLPSVVVSDGIEFGTVPGQTTQDSKPKSSGPKRRCKMCPSTIGRRQKQQCDRCEINVCNAHCTKTVICKKCRN